MRCDGLLSEETGYSTYVVMDCCQRRLVTVRCDGLLSEETGYSTL